MTAPDGLRLHVRRYGAPAERRLPIVCLPGLTRNGSDFHEVASALAHDASQPRLVITIDSRGRGRSDYDRDPDNYSFPVELADVLAVLTALEISPAIFLGTSRGGILAMLLGAHGRARSPASILNDIGPGDRRQGAGAAQGLCRQAADPAQSAGGRRDPAPAR